MTHKEIAERLRKEIRYAEKITGSNLGGLLKLADEIDPPKPETGIVVWWRYKDQPNKGPWIGWHLGMIASDGISIIRDDGNRLIGEIDHKPARILAPDEVAVKLSPVTVWREGSEWVTFGPNIKELQNAVQNTVYHIHGAKPERMQRDD